MLFLVSWSRVLRVLVFAVAASLPLGAAPLDHRSLNNYTF